jgi:glycosyltransferase involved in cell wall biosynthesis
LYQLYRALCDSYDIEFVTMTSGGKPTDLHLLPHLCEIQIPQSKEFLDAYCEKQAGFKQPVADMCMIFMSCLIPDYHKALSKSVATSDMVILSHPYLYPEIEPLIGDRPFIYEAQDVEIHLKTNLLQNEKNREEADALLARVREVEKACCEKSVLILTCSQDDKLLLQSIYGVKEEKVIVVPNGVDTKSIRFTSVQKRMCLKEEQGLSHEKLALFVGSNHPPNLDACRAIFEIAKNTPDVKYLLMGTQCYDFSEPDLPNNVGLLGMVDHFAKRRIYEIVDVALNPIESGSGTNLKMFDYLSAGLPTLTTPFGARGIDRQDIFLTAQIDEMAPILSGFSLESMEEMVERARLHVEEYFDWQRIADSLIPFLETYV